MTDLRITFLRPPFLVLAALGVAIALIVAGPMAKAQTQPTAPSAPQTIPDDKLQAFAVASLDVQQIAKSYQEQVKATESTEKQEALKQQRMEEMISAVQAAGLQVAEYNAIQQAYSQDKQLRALVDNYIEQIQK
ncbi:DUF4168 domain-containing protein [Aestuariispira ectoiniformans]|uniref:DUF4168 domain-containing protein n=1 Tax=Aestuariispira ectoiniformans TaxID=2775080 RepID=UPI00223C0119|nr:DUF4168 domain-containing protein [Aestuariispira ectoiniformans]